jgi:hypothetical protein
VSREGNLEAHHYYNGYEPQGFGSYITELRHDPNWCPLEPVEVQTQRFEILEKGKERMCKFQKVVA